MVNGPEDPYQQIALVDAGAPRKTIRVLQTPSGLMERQVKLPERKVQECSTVLGQGMPNILQTVIMELISINEILSLFLSREVLVVSLMDEQTGKG